MANYGSPGKYHRRVADRPRWEYPNGRDSTVSLFAQMVIGAGLVGGAIGGVIVAWALTHQKYRRLLRELGELRRMNGRLETFRKTETFRRGGNKSA